MTESSFVGKDGLRIATRAWRPSSGTPRGVVVIVPGFNSHGGYYEWTAGQLVSAGLAVYSIDLRGRGKSEGERFFVEDFLDYVTDVADYITIVKEREAGLPVFLLGHSAGGVVACLYAMDYQSELSGLICESFAFQVPAPDFAIAILKGLSHVVPHAHVLKLHNADFSRDPKVVEFMNNDPLIANESQPTQTIAAMVRADDRLGRDFETITLPVLILHGTSDKATKPSGSQQFFDTTGSADKTLKFYQGGYHDLLNDLDKEVVVGDILQWIAERV
ncbi:MAG TPA: lysophospholipase [Puia sp.]|jgi:acylglycerol lipase|nr:lysophospholipase [Puia sp.]